MGSFFLLTFCRFLIHKIGPKISRYFLFGFGFHWIRIRGRQADSAEAPILVVAPHSSVFDAFIVGSTYAPSFVSKGGIRGIPVFGSKCCMCVQMLNMLP